jgi:hypothetical protein
MIRLIHLGIFHVLIHIDGILAEKTWFWKH